MKKIKKFISKHLLISKEISISKPIIFFSITVILIGGITLGGIFLNDKITQNKLELNLAQNAMEIASLREQRALKLADEKEKLAEKERDQRIIAEENAEQESIARLIAEKKRKQEETTRKIAEQELATQEARTIELNSDKDGDGLSYQEELSAGTLDTNTDSDSDGINDKEDINPAGGGRYIAQHFEWYYNNSTWTWDYSIHEDWYEYYKNKPRTSHGLEYVTENDPFIKEVAKMLKDEAEKNGYSTTLFITSFVQGLSYVKDSYTSFDEYPKYPVETFIERNGDCEDTSYLTASLINASGYGSALIELSNHMAIAVKFDTSHGGNYYELTDGRYYYFETTGEGWVLGETPLEYQHEQAKITNVWNGETTYSYPKYKKPCDPSTNYPGYYYSEGDIYRDSQCTNKTSCLPSIYSGRYWDGYSFYIDSYCTTLFSY